MNWDTQLEKVFGNYASDSEAERWKNVTENLKRGDHIEGKVVARTTFGIWVDVGLGFPALLEIIHIWGMSPDMYAEDKYYPIGSKVQAMVRSYTTQGHQIRLEQTLSENEKK